jgi:hypothetical protein
MNRSCVENARSGKNEKNNSPEPRNSGLQCVRMLAPVAAYHQFGWDGVLVLTATGFLFGLGTNLRGPIGIAVGSNTIDAARCPEAYRQPRLPLLPRCVFGALLLTALGVLRYWNSPFLSDHALYVICLAGVTLSVGAWLIHAYGFVAAADVRKAEEIREFLSDPQALVPQGQVQVRLTSQWLRIWNALNFTAFDILTLIAIRGFLTDPPLR